MGRLTTPAAVGIGTDMEMVAAGHQNWPQHQEARGQIMDQKPDRGESEQEKFEHGHETEHADEAAKPGDIGALDGPAAAGSAGAVSDGSDDEGGIPATSPDPSVGPD
jgi:hypothetical protein